MNWKKNLFKPDWQNRKADVRAEAVAKAHDPELLAALESIALEDEDREVRVAAVRRLEDPVAVDRVRQALTDGATKDVAAERLHQLCCAHEGFIPPLAQRVQVVGASDDRNLLERTALLAPEAELRRIAIERIDRQGFLGDRAIEDPDDGVRRAAAARISQRSTLRRVIAELRTRDKELHQSLEERLQAELFAEGDPAAVKAHAELLCERLDKLALHPDRCSAAGLEGLQGEWAAVADTAPEILSTRFNNTLQRLRKPPQAPIAELPEPSVEPGPAEDVTTGPPAVDEKPEPEKPEPEKPEPEKPEPEKPEPVADAGLIACRNRFRKLQSEANLGRAGFERARNAWRDAWKALEKPGPADREIAAEIGQIREALRQTLAEKNAARIDKAGKMVDALAEQLEGGELHTALETRKKLHDLTRTLDKPGLPRALKARLAEAQLKMREMRDWLHWSNNKIRKRLLTEIEGLRSVDLHPDAVLDRLHELQLEWKNLEQSEQIPGDRRFLASPGLWRKFQAEGHKTFDAVKPFLEKRSAIREHNLEEIAAQASALAELARAETPDWPTLRRQFNEARKQLRSLDGVPPARRHAIAMKIKRSIGLAGERLKENESVIEKEKRKLIRLAAQLVHVADLEEALSTAKSLQSRWRSAGSLRRGIEQKLWLEFRQHLDPLFEQDHSKRAAYRADQDAVLSEQKSVIESLEALLASNDEEIIGQRGRVQGLKDQWGEFSSPDRRLQARFQKDLDAFTARLRKQKSAEQHAQRERLWMKSDILHRVENVIQSGDMDALGELKATWPDEAASHGMNESYENVESQLDRRLALAGSADSGVNEADADAARLMCIRLEFLAGLASPDEDRQRRMEYQVSRLSDSMTGGVQQSARDEALEAECEWLLQGWLADKVYAPLKQRAESALKEIYKE